MFKKLKMQCIAAIAALPMSAFAGVQILDCNVAVNYKVNGTVTSAFTYNFSIAANGGTIFYDFSTATRQREFSATASQVGNEIVVDFDYFNDVGVFQSIDLRGKLRMRDSKGNSTEGEHTLYNVSGTTTAHNTAYTLACRRV